MSTRFSHGVVRSVGIIVCVMLLAPGTALAQDIGLGAEVVAVGPTPGGVFPGGFLAEFFTESEFFDLAGKAQVAVDARCPQRNLTEYTGLTMANVEGSRAVFVTTRTGFGRVCKIVCPLHGLHVDSPGEPNEPSTPPAFNPDPMTGEQSLVYIWDFARRSRDGSVLVNFGAPGATMVIDETLPGNPLIPFIKEGDKIKLVFVGGDNVITKTYKHPLFFWEKGVPPIRQGGAPENTP